MAPRRERACLCARHPL